jgi:hypothetical protein
MRWVVPGVLLLVALIHFLPVMGVAGAAQLSRLYGLPIQDASLEILMRHRAVLFGLLGAFLTYAAFKPALHGLALVAALISVAAFLVLAFSVGGHNQAVATVVKVDVVALVLIIIGAAVYASGQYKAA